MHLPSDPLPGRLTLLIVAVQEMLAFNGVSEIILGRTSASNPERIEVDLSPYEAYQAGVSRQHARIDVHGSTVTVTDLASANGTRLNGQALHPHTACTLKNEDILTLGTLKIQIKFSAPASGRE